MKIQHTQFEHCVSLTHTRGDVSAETRGWCVGVEEEALRQTDTQAAPSCVFVLLGHTYWMCLHE